jgi:hypothetical protein
MTQEDPVTTAAQSSNSAKNEEPTLPEVVQPLPGFARLVAKIKPTKGRG